jgi:hypothetical protein
MKDSSLDELVKVLDMGEGDLSVCGELCKGLDPGAIFDASIGDYGSHLLSSEQVTALQTYITKREREARIDELKELIKPRECYRPSCKQEHTLLRKKYVKDRIKELNTSEGE